MSSTHVIAEPGSLRIAVTREFDAPIALVYRAWTEPEMLVQWLGPRRLKMSIDHWDLRHGGSYRYVHTEPGGTQYAFRGVFHGEPSPAGLVQTFEFEGYPGHVSLDTARFGERDGRTTVRIESVFQSTDDRDGMIASGMESGMNEGLERLDELLVRATVPA